MKANNMALLPQIFITKDLPTGEGINQNNQKSLQDCISEAIQAMASYELNVQNIKIGVGIVRFAINKKDKDGWYVFNYDDGVLFGAFGNHKISSVDQINFTSRSYHQLSPVQQHEINLRIKQRQEEMERLRIENHEFVAGKALELMNTPIEHFTHKYINSKQVNIYHNLRNIDNTLFIPLWDYTGKLWNWQKIYFDESTGRFEKRYFKPTEDASGRKHGCFYPVDGKDDIILICEGYSTGATLHEKTGQTIICAMDSGNILPVVKDLRKNPRFTQSRFIICADNDYSSDTKAQERITNTLNEWKQYAEVVMPPKGATSGYDFNDMACGGQNVKDYIFPTDDDWLIDAEDMMSNLTPLSFIIDGLIPDYGLGMLHGQSGHGKTFLNLDLAYHIATNMDWHGKKTKGGNVVYLAGEGHHSLKFRLIGLKQKYGQSLKGKMHISKAGCNLNMLDGYEKARIAIKKVIEKTNESPKVIFVDTLHRFLEGDENSSKDAKTMIDACDKLKYEFGCTVILVHHTGLNADDRARGSSSWKGAMDFEYNIKKSGNALTFYCKKMKDSEEHKPIVFNLKCVDLIGINHETGKPVTTLLLELAENQEPPKPRDKETENKVKEDTNTLKACWRERGEVHEGRAYVSYLNLESYMRERMDYTDSQIKKLSCLEKNRFIGRLIKAKIIERLPHNNHTCYFFLDPATNFALINTQKEGNYDNNHLNDDDDEIPF
jgi:phage/plasmid primase-like uncharacterized protein/KaiC/GvpD/RAD55 family RecA-like ATPase